MAIELQPGPLVLIDIDAVLGRAPTLDLEGFVAGRVGDVLGADDRLAANLSIMAPDLDGLGPDDPGADLDDATGAHTIQASEPDPDFSGEVTAAEVGSAQLARLAGTLPADPDAGNTLSLELEGDGFEGVDWPGTLPAPAPGTRPPNSGDAGDPDDPRTPDRDRPEPPAPGGPDVDRSTVPEKPPPVIERPEPDDDEPAPV